MIIHKQVTFCGADELVSDSLNFFIAFTLRGTNLATCRKNKSHFYVLFRRKTAFHSLIGTGQRMFVIQYEYTMQIRKMLNDLIYFSDSNVFSNHMAGLCYHFAPCTRLFLSNSLR